MHGRRRLPGWAIAGLGAFGANLGLNMHECSFQGEVIMKGFELFIPLLIRLSNSSRCKILSELPEQLCRDLRTRAK